MLKLNLVYYGNHDAEVYAAIIEARPEFLIGNTAHGLWGAINSHSADWLLQDTAKFKATGIKVIGYITAGYEGQGSNGDISSGLYTQEKNLEFISDMAEIDKVDGVFIDECSEYPGEASRQYLLALTAHAHSYGLITWANVGVDDFDPWYLTDGGFDFVHSSEAWQDQKLTDVQTAWGQRLSVTGLVDPSCTLEQAVDLTVKAWEKGIAFCYITPTYELLPQWFAEYVGELRLVR